MAEPAGLDGMATRSTSTINPPSRIIDIRELPLRRSWFRCHNLKMMLGLTLRRATPMDIADISALIERSVHGLQAAEYTQRQRDAAIGHVFLVDRGLIADGSYFVVETAEGRIVGAGGWSNRMALHGAHTLADTGERIDPAKDPARIRAYFVDPDFARKGIASAILKECEAAARSAGFTHSTLGATLTGIPFYMRYGYVESGREETPLPDEQSMTIVHMVHSLTGSR